VCYAKAYLVTVEGGVLDGAYFEVHADCERQARENMRWALLNKRTERVLPSAVVVGRVLRPRQVLAGEPTVYMLEWS
jgi:hypothetical protein